MSKVDVVAPGKLILLGLVVLGAFAYIIASMVTGDGDATPAWAVITLIVGYAVGNGVGAARGATQAPLFAPRPTEEDGAE